MRLAKSTGDPKKVSINGPVTKDSVEKKVRESLSMKFPDVTIPDQKIKEYSNLLLVSGLSMDAMNKIFEMEAERQQ